MPNSTQKKKRGYLGGASPLGEMIAESRGGTDDLVLGRKENTGGAMSGLEKYRMLRKGLGEGTSVVLLQKRIWNALGRLLTAAEASRVALIGNSGTPFKSCGCHVGRGHIWHFAARGGPGTEAHT